MSHERPEGGPHLTRRQFLIAAGTATAAILGGKFIVEQRDTPPMTAEQILIFKDGAIINLVDGLVIDVSYHNVNKLISSPLLQIDKPNNIVITHFFFEQPIITPEDGKHVEKEAAKIAPYVLSKLALVLDPEISEPKEVRSISSISTHIAALKKLPSFSDINIGLSYSMSLEWLDITRQALHEKLGKPNPKSLLYELTLEKEDLIIHNLPITVNKIPDRILRNLTI